MTGTLHTNDSGRVAIVGSGVIGRGWAALFARAGFTVSVYDPAEGVARGAVDAATGILFDLEAQGLLDDAEAAVGRLHAVASLDAAVAEASYVQESAPENVAVKADLLAKIDSLAPSGTPIGSSCSAIVPELFMREIPGRARCIVAHPFNPPHAIPLVELVTSEWTSEETVGKVRALMEQIGQAPIVVRKTLPGYVANRLQAAVVNESMHLVAAGVVSPADLDLALRSGLGLRWAFMGPFETMDLNARGGFADYAAKFGTAYMEMGAQLRVHAPWEPEALQRIEAWRRSEVPLDELPRRERWRDRVLMQLRRFIDEQRPAGA